MKSKKGQISIEFMLIILITLTYLQLLTATVINPSIDSVEDTTRMGQARLSAEKMTSTINEIASSMGEGKKAINIYVPKDATLECVTDGMNEYIEFSVLLYGTEIAACGLSDGSGTTLSDLDDDNPPDHTTCTKRFPLNVTSTNLTCNFVDPHHLDTMDKDKGLFRPIYIKKDTSGVITVE